MNVFLYLIKIFSLIISETKKRSSLSVEVEVEEFKEEDKIIKIRSIIYVERKSQKGIIIGHKGNAIKHMGIDARKGIEKFFQKKVYLELYVKVDDNWRSKSSSLSKYGY